MAGSLLAVFLRWSLLGASCAAGLNSMVKVVLFIVISVAYDCGVGLAAFPYAGKVLKKTIQEQGPFCRLLPRVSVLGCWLWH